MLGHISIRNRLVSVVLATAMLAIVVAFTIVIYNEVSSIKKDAERNLLVNAELVADYCIDPLVQNRPENAVRVLEKIGIIPAVTHLQLYDSVDSLFASYRTESEEVIPPVGLRPGKLLAREYAVHLRVPVVQKGHNYGTLYLRASNEALHGRISNYIYTMALFVLGLILLIYLLVLRLQNIISAPILQLARIAEKISNEGDLSLRVNRRQRDEFAVLYENFNIMLESLHTRQSHLAAEKEELERSDERLKLVLQSARLGLWDWDIKTGAITFNRYWIETLGYTPGEIEPQRDFLVPLVHPEDVREVTEAIEALLKGTMLSIEVTHRIKTKSGEWRTFAAFGRVVEKENGIASRIVGIHREITEEMVEEERV